MDNTNMRNHIGNQIKQNRKRLNMSQIELGTKMNVAKSTISNYESGYRTPNMADLYKLSIIFKTDIGDFFPHSEINRSIQSLYNQLEETRQTKVYNFAEEQLNEQQNAKVVPIVGTTAANPQGFSYGDPVYDEYSECEAPKNADYAIVVKGDSMEPDFMNGSTVYYHKQEMVENGELAIVEVDNEVTFKKVAFDDKSVILKSINSKYSDRKVDCSRVKIIGKVVQ